MLHTQNLVRAVLLAKVDLIAEYEISMVPYVNFYGSKTKG